jgi:hypothetical protein
MKDVQTIENLYKHRLLTKQNVLTYAQFTGAKEADIEDMFGDAFYLGLVNGEYKKDLGTPVKPAGLSPGSPRILARLESYFAGAPLLNGASFNHYRPARYLAENIGTLEPKLPPESLNRFEEAFRRLNSLVA